MFAVDEARLLTGDAFDVGVGITLYQPTMREILKFGEGEYLSMVSAFTSQPFDMPYHLSQIGIDFAEIQPFELFCLLTKGVSRNNSYLLFGDLDFTKFIPVERNDELILINKDGIIIDSLTRERMADNVRRMHGMSKNIITSCENKFTHDLLISQQKKEIERAQKRADMFGESSAYASLISSLACKWHSYDAVLDLKVGQFFDAIIRMGYEQVATNLYRGIYSGNVSFKDINKKDLDWMRPIKTKNT